MPVKTLVLIGTCGIFLAYSAAHADPPAAMAAQLKYQNCITEQQAKKKAQIAAQCASSSTEAVMAACNAAADKTDDATINYCKLQSGMIDPSNGACTVEEAKNGTGELGNSDDDVRPDDSQLSPAISSALVKHFDSSSNIPVPTARPHLASDDAPSKTASDNSGGSATKPKQTTSQQGSNSNTGSQTNNNNGNNSGAFTTTAPTDDVDAAQAQASADLATCSNIRATAQTCCNNPLSCASNSDRQQMAQLQALSQSGNTAGLAAVCQQMQQTGGANTSINASLGAVCTANQTSCSSTCGSLQQKYQSLVAACTNCTSYSVYTATLAQLSSARSQCDGLQATADALTRQSLQAGSSAYAQYCNQQLNSAGAQSLAQMGNGSMGALDTANSLSAQQAQQRANANQAERGDANFQGAAATGQQKFNLGDLSEFSPQGQIAPVRPSDPARVNTIPNNSGGGFGLGAGSGSTTAQQQQQAAARAQAASGGYPTEIDQGLRSGGGYTQSAATEPSGGFFGNLFGGGRRPAAATDSKLLGLDLRQFLPGGSRDPSRRLAGAGLRSEIGAKEDDIWLKISNKIVEKCKLGVLWNCR